MRFRGLPTFLRALVAVFLLVPAGGASGEPAGAGTDTAGATTERAPENRNEMERLRRELAEARARSERLEEELTASSEPGEEPVRRSLVLPAGMTIPFPQRDLHVKKSDALERYLRGGGGPRGADAGSTDR